MKIKMIKLENLREYDNIIINGRFKEKLGDGFSIYYVLSTRY